MSASHLSSLTDINYKEKTWVVKKGEGGGGGGGGFSCK